MRTHRRTQLYVQLEMYIHTYICAEQPTIQVDVSACMDFWQVNEAFRVPRSFEEERDRITDMRTQ